MTGHQGAVWTLHRRDDGRLIAELAVTTADFPWLYARIDAREGLAEFAALFAEELSRSDRIDDDAEAWERAHEAVRKAVQLRYPNGDEVPEFLLHISADEAWWRWSDEEFQDAEG
ncbi:hypothetical protein [Actinoplanes auranticolor]|uniref:Uncharacterized protein n=1 Tax=Actinoplanes auranticolor TaxID=47988 RepID=A0A919SD85_9ACTN|nr:hypothetical protein [Actinoplanes auranticolor]GIM68883.1 hypothetical protein Aau02nite_33670 [Actinoplanes auranticolor]